ncbi:MAG TPA: hypothetical protein VF522_21190 [Ramlibacter sp.]|uniref:hypothetical protein n=1 Tax=Ramlibacter sp. TaxID=1917967 RepID=UPI002ED3ED58
MDLDTAIHEEVQQMRVAVRGEATLGQLSSLMHVLEVDSRSWRHGRVLLDFSALESRVGETERKLLEQIAAVRLGKKTLAVVWPDASRL